MGGILADRLGWRITLIFLCICQMLIMPVYSLLPFAMPYLLGLSFLWSLFGWAFMAGQQSRLISVAGAQAPVVLALNAAAIYIGAAIGSAIGGVVIAVFGISAIGLAAGLASTIALIHLTLSTRFSPRPPAGT